MIRQAAGLFWGDSSVGLDLLGEIPRFRRLDLNWTGVSLETSSS